VRYLADSVFAFTDLPVRIMLGLGVFGVVTSIGISTIVAVARIMGLIDVPGYAALMLVMSFFAALNMCALGIVGSYLWRTFENTKQRPEAIAMLIRDFSPDASDIPAP
jgi:nicotinamide riboside transporter PnuC